jgi:hypothetical protein
MTFPVIGHCRKGWILERVTRLYLKHFHLHLLLLEPLLSAALGLQLKPCGGLCFVKVVSVEVLVERARWAKGARQGSTKVFAQIIVLEHRCIVVIFEIALVDNGELNFAQCSLECFPCEAFW